MAHGPQALPPQSWPVSLPFLMPSAHDGDWQIAPMHTAVTQSVAALQPVPAGHFWQAPPQSCPVSLPFLTPSVQLAG
jgi:hypothetical protein